MSLAALACLSGCCVSIAIRLYISFPTKHNPHKHKNLKAWWNPAVEDQASDRAHRMGQQRLVTIYRLIMQNSIEEKILELHKNKREMAAEILEGSDTTSKMSEEDLLNLISAEL